MSSPRPRRSCLAVPGSSQKFIDKARTLPVDQVFLDLEDACAPLAKPGARKTIVAALNEGGWGDRIRVVRVNDWTTEWTYRDVVEVVEGAGANLDAIMLPKVQTAEQVIALDLLITQIEKTLGYEQGRIGIEAQIENALGLTNVNAIAAASQRVETIIFSLLPGTESCERRRRAGRMVMVSTPQGSRRPRASGRCRRRRSRDRAIRRWCPLPGRARVRARRPGSRRT